MCATEEEGQGCGRCGGAVFKAEEVRCDGLLYHAQCATCAACARQLSAGHAHVAEGDIYCAVCHDKRRQEAARPAPGVATDTVKAGRGEVGSSNVTSSLSANSQHCLSGELCQMQWEDI